MRVLVIALLFSVCGCSVLQDVSPQRKEKAAKYLCKRYKERSVDDE